VNIRSLINIHQKIGLSAIIILIILSVTGIALNHTEFFSLKKQTVTQQWLYSWYGLKIPELKQQASLETGGQTKSETLWASQFDTDIWVNEKRVTQGELIGLGVTSFGYALVLKQNTLLLSPELELIDMLNNPNAERVSIKTQKPLVLAINNELWQLNPELTDWIRSDQTTTDQMPAKQNQLLPSEIKEKIENNYYQQGLNWERVMLDLHSGRLFGPIGVFIVDIFALLLIVLSISGYYIYRKRKPQRY